jgi:hypothetical protein
MKHTLLAGLAALVLAGGAMTLGRDTPLRAAEIPVPSLKADVSIHAFGDREKTCQEWTDGCRTCSRPNDGAPFCSNMPIACQPAAITCTRRSEPAK